jgi:hypothetical protein
MVSHLYLTEIIRQPVGVIPPNLLQRFQGTALANQQPIESTTYSFNVLNPHPTLSLLRSHLVSKIARRSKKAPI